MMAIAGEANQIFRPVTMFDHGIDGEVEFKDNDGKASGRKWIEHQRCANKPARASPWVAHSKMAKPGKGGTDCHALSGLSL